MRRRDFIKLIAGPAIARPLVARAQTRRIGVLMNLAADDPQSTNEISAFLDGLKERGWTRRMSVPHPNFDLEAGQNPLTTAFIVLIWC